MATGPLDQVLFSTMSILQLIKEAQQQHGLRHGDYQRYRAYCARRVRRIRKSLMFTHGHKSAAKHSAKFQAKKLTAELVTDAKFLLVPLFDAERCWAFAMQLKQEIGVEEHSRKKFHMLNKLRKAVKHSTDLETIAKTLPQVDAATKLESQAYNAWLNGCLQFELQQWQKAMEYFRAANTIYEKLATVVKDAAAIEGYRSKCLEMQPQLRYCAYNSGDETAMSDLLEMRLKIGDEVIGSDLDKLIAQTLEKQASARKAEVTWCGHVIPLEKPSKVHAFYNTHQQFDADLKKAKDFDDKMALYEKLLIECRDAIQAVRDETKNENLKGRKTAGTDVAMEIDSHVVGVPLSQPQLVHSYLTFVRLSRTVDRYLEMIEQAQITKKAKPQDLVRLYDTVQQNLTEMETIPGVESDQKFARDLNIKTAYFKPFRCYRLAEAYATMKKWPECLALYDRTLDEVTEAKKLMKKASASVFNDMISMEKLEELAQKVNGAKYTAQANSLFATQEQQQEGAEANVVYDKPLLQDLATYRQWNQAEVATGKIPPLLRMPPEFQPMPCKPLFFDLALNHVQFPSLEGQIDTQMSGGSKADQTGEGQGGISGLVKGWFWGKK